MCGIVGIAGPGDLSVISAMTDTLTHRGPKEGRLRLLREVRAQLEPLFFLYQGGPPAERPERAPDVEVEGVRLWRLPPDGIAPLEGLTGAPPTVRL